MACILEMSACVVVVYIHGTGGRGNRDSIRCLGDRRFEFLPFRFCFGTSLRSHEHVSEYGEDSQSHENYAYSLDLGVCGVVVSVQSRRSSRKALEQNTGLYDLYPFQDAGCSMSTIPTC